MYADVIYTLSIIITRSRAVFWNNTHMYVKVNRIKFIATKTLCLFSLTTPIQHHPRNYAPRPILPSSLSFFTALKLAPEEFYQIETTMATRRTSGFAPILCHVRLFPYHQ